MTPEHKAAIAEGKRKAKEARAAAAIEDFGDQETTQIATEVPERRSNCVAVKYRPFDGDPHTTKWNGIVFRANESVALDPSNPLHHIEQLLPKEFAGVNGEVHTKHRPTKVFMGDLAKGNPSFEVDGVRAPKLVNKRVLPPAGHGWAEDHEDEISASTQIDTEA